MRIWAALRYENELTNSGAVAQQEGFRVCVKTAEGHGFIRAEEGR